MTTASFRPRQRGGATLYPWVALRAEATRRAGAYLETCRALGQADADGVWLDAAAVAENRRRCPLKPTIQPGGVLTQAGRLARALGRWAAAGLPVVSLEVARAREAVCAACPHRRPGLMVRCSLCGCGRAKLLLGTERCPDDPRRW